VVGVGELEAVFEFALEEVDFGEVQAGDELEFAAGDQDGVEVPAVVDDAVEPERARVVAEVGDPVAEDFATEPREGAVLNFEVVGGGADVGEIVIAGGKAVSEPEAEGEAGEDAGPGMLGQGGGAREDDPAVEEDAEDGQIAEVDIAPGPVDGEDPFGFFGAHARGAGDGGPIFGDNEGGIAGAGAIFVNFSAEAEELVAGGAARGQVVEIHAVGGDGSAAARAVEFHFSGGRK